MVVNKRTKKFEQKHLKQTITDRRKYQAKKKEIEGRKQKRASKATRNGKDYGAVNGGSKGKGKAEDQGEEDEEDGSDLGEEGPDMTVDDLLNAKGLESNEEDSSEEELDDNDDLESLGSDEDSAHGMDLEALKNNDPEFYKYLEENDRDLLKFDPNTVEAEDEEEDEEMAVAEEVEEDEEATPSQTVVTKQLLRTWQKAILEKRSMRAMRKLLLAFRGAAFSASDDDRQEPFTVESSSVFNSLVKTTLKYLPVYLSHVLPAKELANGKFKLATHAKMYTTAQRMLKSYYVSLLELVGQLPSQSAEGQESTSDSLLYTAISESAKLTPWLVGNRMIVKVWTRTLLEFWATAEDQVRIASFLALRRMALASDASTMETIMKGVYTNLVRSSKNTSAFTLPSITLMKNSAVELYLTHPETSYQLIFSYIRQLAIHLRNSMKIKSKEGFQAVYNWQFIHSLDFWSLVLSAACDSTTVGDKGLSPLHPLIYPLVQITIGVIKLIPTSRYYPLRFHCVRLLLRLLQRTGTFIPVAPFLFEVLDSPDFRRRPKNTNLKPLDWEYYVRAPKQYHHSRIYADGIAEEAVFLLLEYYAHLSRSIAFPELALPAVVMLKRFAKRSKNPKLGAQIKTLVEKLELNQTWISERRAKVNFGPGETRAVDRFLRDEDAGKTPLGMHLRLQIKIRDQKRATLEKAARDDIMADE